MNYIDICYENMKNDETYINDYNAVITESLLISEKDIYYNKEAFDNGDINLCFIIGYSGSGKTTMSKDYINNKNTEVIELDDCAHRMEGFSDNNIKEYGSLMSNFWLNSTGIDIRKDWNAYINNDIEYKGKSYSDEDVLKTFINFAIKYANSHKNIKFILEGIWPLLYYNPETFKDYAVYIKGTSAVKSIMRATKREFNNGNNLKEKMSNGKNQFIGSVYIASQLKNNLNKFQKYFLNKMSEDIMTEAESVSYIYKTGLAERVDRVLNTPEGQRKFINLVGDYVNRNNTKLTTSGPVYQLAFTQPDKDGFFNLFDIDPLEINKLTKEVTTKINDKASWPLIKQNPIFVLFYFIIRNFTMKKDNKALNSALIIMALSVYPSVFSNYFKFETNQGVMQYTIDNLSKRFIIKKTNHIFGTLTYSIQNSWKFHETGFKDGSDINCINFIRRIRNDQNSLIKKIANNYYENYKKGLTVYTTIDSFEDNINVDLQNNTNKVELITTKVITSILMNGLNIDLCNFAAQASNTSKLELRNYLMKILVEKKSDEMKAFVESILFLFLYTDKHNVEEIHSKLFLGYTLALFKKTNSKDPNIVNIKNTLDKWGDDSGLYGKFSRKATRVDYTKGIFMYFIICIQKYS